MSTAERALRTGSEGGEGVMGLTQHAMSSSYAAARTLLDGWSVTSRLV